MKKIFFILLITHLTLVAAEAQWFQLNSGTVSTLNSLYFINVTTGFCSGNGIILKTTNGGMNWINVYSASADFRSILFTDSNTGYSVNTLGNVIKTVNGGTNWITIFTASGWLNGMYFIDQNTGYAVGGGPVMIKTTNAGSNWIYLSTGINNNLIAVYFLDTNTGFVTRAGDPGAIYKTTNSGANWYNVFGYGFAMGSIFFTDLNTGFVTHLSGSMVRTTNGGSNWTTQYIGGSSLESVFFPTHSNGYVVGYNGTILMTTDGGSSWTPQSGPANTDHKSVFFPSLTTGYIAGYYGVILKTTNGGVTAVQIVSSEIPTEFRLYQNYPNPFNPKTKIKFDNPLFPLSEKGDRRGFVTLKIYDILGREVATLVSEKLKPGTYEVEWEGTNYPSGIYFYELSAAGYSKTNKMVLLK